MIIPTLDHLQAFIDTLAPRDGEDFVTITMPLSELRALVGSRLTNDRPPPYDVERRW